MPAIASAAAPTATTDAATDLTVSSATLNATVNPGGEDTTYRFEYVDGTAFKEGGYEGAATVPVVGEDIGAGSKDVEVGQTISGLESGTTYHYRVVAENAQGEAVGEDVAFVPAEWVIAPTEQPEESSGVFVGSALAGSSCTSTTECTAVGHYRNPEEVTLALAERREGEKWVIEPTPNPEGAKESRLESVSCAGVSTCLAVGRYKNPSGTLLTLAERWDGKEWSLLSTPNPEGAKESRLESVSCAVATDCFAAGYYKTGTEFKTLIERWNGSSWSIVSSPNPEGSASAYLYGVSCPSSSDCWAVGKAGANALAEHYDGSAWSLASLSEPPAQLTDVSCPSTIFCLALLGEGLEVERYDGSSWSPFQSAAQPPETEGATLSGVSCTSASACTAAGYNLTGEAQIPLAEHWDGAEWTIQEAADPHEVLEGALPYGSFQSVSCATASACVATGSYFGESGHVNLVAETHRPGALPVAITEAAADLTISSATLKATVNPGGEDTTYRFEYVGQAAFEESGYEGATSAPVPDEGIGSGAKDVEVSQTVGGLRAGTIYHYRVVAENIEGKAIGGDVAFFSSEWVIAPTEQPEESSGVFVGSALAGSSCTSATECTAVGHYRNPEEVTLALAERREGEKWVIEPTPNPEGAKESRLESVSCAGVSTCLAVGRYKNSSGTLLTLAERWDGSSWSIVSTPNPEGAAESRLESVSCTSASDCIAAGYYKYNAEFKTLIERWNGSSWRIVPSPEPEGYSRSYLYGVSCVSTSECWAVGEASNTAAEEKEGKDPPRALLERYDGSAWSLASLSEPPAQLTDVSCPSTIFCLALLGEGLEVERYDGSSWSPFQSAAQPPETEGATLSGVSCTSASACTAAGYNLTGEAQIPLAEHWDGAEWTIQEAADPHEVLEGALPYGSFQSVSCATASACVATGSYFGESGHVNLVAETHRPGALPVAITEAAADLTISSAALKATVNPGGEDTTYRFEIGDSTSYWGSMPVGGKGIGSGAKDIEVSLPLSGLQAGSTYHYRVVAENAEGEAAGEDETLTTPSPPIQSGFGPVFSPGYERFPQQFTLTGSSALFDTGSLLFSCGGSTIGDGSFTSEHGGEMTLVFQGCRDSAYGSYFTSPGQSKGTILTAPLKVKLVYLDEADNEVGLLLTPLNSEVFAEFEWMGGLVEGVVTGDLMATMSAPGLYEISNGFDFETWGFGPWQVEGIGQYHSLKFSSNGGQATEMSIDASYEATFGGGGEGELHPEPENPEFIDPEISNQTATEVGAHKATLGAEIDLNGVPAYYEFQYGTSESYGSKIPIPSHELSGAGVIPVSANLQGLKEETTYHYRVVASSEYGKAIGPDQEFTTKPEPDTTITSSTPSFTSGAISEVEFTSDTPGATFVCSLESEPPYRTDFSEEACESPYKLPKLAFESWHTFTVTAVDGEGNRDESPATWKFQTGLYPPAPESSKLISPQEGERSAAFVTLQAEVGDESLRSAIDGVRFQVKAPSKSQFETIPAEYVLNGKGDEVSWPLPVDPETGKTEPVFFNIKKDWKLGWSSGSWVPFELKFRAAFDGDPSVEGAIGASKPANVMYSRRWGGSNDATETIGPATLDLLTGYDTITRTDVSIPVPGYEANLEFSRTYYSGAAGGWIAGAEAETEVLGGNWQPSAPVEAEYPGEAWQRIVVQHQGYVPPKYNPTCEKEQEEIEEELKKYGEWTEPFNKEECLEEYAIPEANWVEVLDNEGAGIPFDRVGATAPYTYAPPEEAKEFKLTFNEAEQAFILVDSNGTHTEFTRNGTTNEYQPHAIWFAGTAGQAQMIYEVVEGKRRLKMIIAPATVTCNASKAGGNYAPETVGCRSLTFAYKDVYVSVPGQEQLEPRPRLGSITYHNATGDPNHTNANAQVVAEYEYCGWSNGNGRLKEEWDPRVSPPLKEKYSYEAEHENSLETLTPPGEEPWEFAYYHNNDWRLKSVSRASLLEGDPTATTTIAYGVPLSGSSAPYAMGAASVAEWGQTDYPVNATAIFPPTEVPDEIPSDYNQATIHYMDPDGYKVNTASPAPPGVEGDTITTAETDSHGDVVRQLGARARLQALASADPVDRSRELDTHSTYKYEEDGAKMVESQSWGPLHQVRLESGNTVQARSHTTTKYDEGFDHKEGEPWPQLPTEEIAGAVVPGEAGELESRVSMTHYEWKFRKPTESIVDPNGLDLVTRTAYNSAGQVIEERQPSNSEGQANAGTTKTVYWTAESNPENSSCGGKAKWAGLPCVTYPAADPSPAEGNPKLPWTWFIEYSPLDQPKEIQEKTNGVLERTTTATYDNAGRPESSKQTGEGIQLPATETLYDSTTGRPYQTRFQKELTSAEQLSGLPTINAFDGSSTSLANFNSNWSTLGWAGGSTPKGSDTTTGWRPVDAYPTVNGAYYNQTINDTGSGLAALATMAVNPGSTSRYFSIWLDMPTPSGARGGYELRFTDTSTNTYEVKLSRWVGGTQTVLASKSSYSFSNGNSFAVIDQGSTVSAWTNTGSGFAQLLSASDSTFSGGNAGVAGSGNITRLTNFRAGSFSSFSGPVTTTYDKLGRPIKYEDADGNESKVAYDLLGRPYWTSDGKGEQLVTYDEASGVATEMTDSAAGTFKATYNADGQMTEQLLPDGLAQKISYNPAGEAIGLTYEKTNYCSSSCTWLSFAREDSIGGQVLKEESTLGNHEYTYDKAGRLTLAKEYGTGGFCTTRAYAFDKDSNRTSRITREPKENGACDTTSEGSKTSYGYDTADRLIKEGVEYDNLGRITSLPAKYSGGGTLTNSYYVDDLTRSQTQGEVTNTYNLDASLRERERVRTGGSEAGTEIYHYAGSSDSPAWTQEGTAWSRTIGALGGGLGAIQRSNGEITLQLANMHGDVVASASIKPEETKLPSTQSFDEFGNPVEGNPLQGGSPEYGWLGIKGRRTQFSSGVIQMGKRSYVPDLGRFLSPDPVPGGSCNTYDYACQDPVNNFDLTGERFCEYVHNHQVCGRNGRELGRNIKQYKRERRKAGSVSRRSVTIVLIERRGGSARASGIGGALKGALDYVYHKVGGGVKKIGNGFASLTLSGPEYKAARKAFTLSMAWSPDRLIQAWQCGEYVAGAGRSFGDCDPWEMWNGAPPDSAR